MVPLRVGGSILVRCLPLNVHSFKTQRSLPAASSGDAYAATNAAASQGGGHNSSNHNAADVEGGGNDAAAGGGSALGGVPSGPSAAELTGAVSSVLRRAGVPIGLETQKLLELNLSLQSEVQALNKECEERSLEANKAREQLESAERTITCQVCMQRKVDTLLVGCGHMLCAGCTPLMQRCPFCRDEMTAGSMRLRWA